MVRIYAVAVLFTALFGAMVPQAVGEAAKGSSSAASPPNIVLIISDDQGWNDFSFMGHPHIKTPNIDRLASESLTFTHGYVTSSLCCPSLAAIITGLYPHENKITGNDPIGPKEITRQEFRKTPDFQKGRELMNRHMEAVPTLPRQLAKDGYLSLQTGKWWQGNYHRGGFTDGMTQGERHGDAGLEIGRKTMQPIYDFIAKAQTEKKPFFLWYAPMMPHQPHNPPQRILKKYAEVAPTTQIAKYWGMVDWFDETVGALLKHLDEQKLSDNTIVMFVVDNGWITDPKTGKYAPKSKQSQYDGGVRTPIMIRWPGHVKPQKSEALASSLDIAPTLLAAAKLQPTSQMSGLNLLDSQTVAARKELFGECFLEDSMDPNNPAASLKWRWTIDGKWKLIVPDAHNRPDDKVELYDLAADPFEEHNVAADHEDVVKKMSGSLDKWWDGRASQPLTR